MILPYIDFVVSKEAPCPPGHSVIEFRLFHAALGLSTEMLELTISKDSENTKEELADLLYYFALTIDVTLPKSYIPSLPEKMTWKGNENVLTLQELTTDVESLISLCKKHLIYRSSVHDKIVEQLASSWEAFLLHVAACSLTLEELITYSEEKLNLRYKSAFSRSESELRRDKKSDVHNS